MEWLSGQSFDVVLLCIGLSLILLELFVMVGVPLFFGIGCLITAILAHFNVVDSWGSISIAVSLSTAISAALLWKPLKKFQNREVPLDTSSDMIGRVLVSATEINRDSGAVHFSGTELLALLSDPEDEPIEIGSSVKVVSITGTRLHVKKVEATK